MNISLLKEQVKRFNTRISTHGGKRYIACWTDLLWSSLRFGCIPDDYFRYEFNRKSGYEKNKFITYRRSKRHILNGKQKE